MPRWTAASLFSCTLALLLNLFGAVLLPVSSTELEAKITENNLSTELGIPIYSWGARTQGDPKAIVLAIHGATLHATSFDSISHELADKGYAVFATDMRGFGAWYKNHPDPKDPSRRVLYCPSAEDLHSLIAKLKVLYPNKAIFLMGESVGANMALRLLAEDPDCADGLILSSPAVKQRLFIGPTTVLQFLTILFKPATQLDISAYLRSRVSENPEIVAERINDPLGRNKMNVGELFKTRFFNKDCLKLLPLIPDNVSILLLEGTEDRLFDAKDVEKLLGQLSSTDKTLHWIKGKGHIHLETVHLEPEVVDTVSSWLANQTAQLSKAQGHEMSSLSVEHKNIH